MADMVEPPVDSADPYPLVERLRDAPGKITGYVQGMAKSVSKQLLAFMKFFYPNANLSPVAEGIVGDCTDEVF